MFLSPNDVSVLVYINFFFFYSISLGFKFLDERLGQR